jgi:Putative Ig domain
MSKIARRSEFARVVSCAVVAILLFSGIQLALGTPAPPQGASKLTIATKALPNAVVGVEYNFVVAATGGEPPYDFSGTGLPPNLAFHPSSDTIGGKAATAGTYTVVITVRDSSDPKEQTASTTFKLTVVAAQK